MLSNGPPEVSQFHLRKGLQKEELEALAVEEGQTEASETIEIIVNVIDQNDNKPVFSRDTFQGEVPQSSAKGFQVMTVQATDSDEENSDNSDICYRIISQEPEEPNPSMFAINATTGVITVEATGLDREKHPQYTLTVTAADMRGEGLIGTAKVILTITDSSSPVSETQQALKNRHGPLWLSLKALCSTDWLVPENVIGPFPLQLAQIRFKEDETKKIIYSISGPGADQPPVGLFTMDGDTGHLYVTQGLDRENQDKYTVNAVAEDGGTTVGQTQAVVKVTDQNDNKPVFNKDTYEGEVPEASPRGILSVGFNQTYDQNKEKCLCDCQPTRVAVYNEKAYRWLVSSWTTKLGKITLEAVGCIMIPLVLNHSRDGELTNAAK
ncbi:hypothetical protein CCH79_00017294 [Gambusia affinis]|uniref:Cadherin domain-containing protein n=1 Tax=Gambusia affinis TaxID=33528 RepID=A0A315VHF5_GAMAF|nr:hypothetical protein CCH79_00017294 [Gambusia affinis]